MARPKKTETSSKPTPADIVKRSMEILDGIKDERAALNERKKGALAPLIDELAMSADGIRAFLKRRRMTDEARMHFDNTFKHLCDATNEPFQPDLFDAIAAADIEGASLDPARSH